jgi:CRISPR-associated endoribonuclease Cas6
MTKLIHIKKGKPNQTKIKAFVSPLQITAEPEMQQVAYDCGIGEKNSLGCGCLGVENK